MGPQQTLAERRLKQGWLRAYAEYTEGTESPPLFHFWVGISALCGAAQRKVFLDAGYFRIHSNMYIVLVSPAGRSRKSTALRIGKNLLKGIMDWGQDVHFSTQASSVAALVQQLSKVQNKEHQSLTAFSSELGSLLGNKPAEMTDFLMDIYDCEPDWNKQTVGRGLEKIEKPWFNLLGATTPQWLGDNMPKTAVEGGFVSRTVFVYEDTRLLVALPSLTKKQQKLERDLIHDLARIATLKGEFSLTPDARDFYKEWYEDPKRLRKQTDYRIASYYERKHINVLKVAMAISLSEKDELVLSVDDIGRAIDALTELEPGMHKAFRAVGKNIYSTDIERIKDQIYSANGMSYKELVGMFIHDVEREKLDELISALAAMGEIELTNGKWSPAKNGKHAG